MLLHLEGLLKLPPNTFKVSVIVESVHSVLELEEIIFALKHRIVGLNAGRWNYIFSVVKSFKN
jgi:malate synthase